jgi:hypothetical protein
VFYPFYESYFLVALDNHIASGGVRGCGDVLLWRAFDISIARAKVIYSWNVPPLMFQVGFLTMSIDGLVTNWGTPMVWMFFAMMGITAMQITVRLILYYFINKYANVKPYRVTKNTPNEATFYMDGERD